MQLDNVLIENYNEYRYLFKIVSAVINRGEIPKISNDINYDVLYKISRENRFDSFLYYAINDKVVSNLSDEVLQKTYYSLSKSVNREKILDKTLNQIVNMFEENKIKHCILKGSYIKNYYPQKELRYMVDIDILVHEKDIDIIDKLLKKSKYKLKSIGNIEYEYKSPDNINIEIHKRLLDNTKKNHEYFGEVWKETVLREGYNYSYYLEEATYYIYITEHCLKHFLSGGFSARMILDFYVFNKYISNDLVKNRIEIKLKEIGLLGFAKQIEEISNRWYSLNAQGLQKKLIDKYIVENKDMCNKLNFVLLASVNIEKDGKKVNKYNYMMGKIFISYKNLSKYYNNLLYKPYLYPVYYMLYLIYRLKQLFSRNNKFKTLPDIKKIDENRNNIEDMKKLIKVFDIEKFI